MGKVIKLKCSSHKSLFDLNEFRQHNKQEVRLHDKANCPFFYEQLTLCLHTTVPSLTRNQQMATEKQHFQSVLFKKVIPKHRFRRQETRQNHRVVNSSSVSITPRTVQNLNVAIKNGYWTFLEAKKKKSNMAKNFLHLHEVFFPDISISRYITQV